MADRDVQTEAQPSVRFASEHEEISPAPNVERDDLSKDVQQELKNLSLGIHKSRLQEHRMQNFAFEPVSLPPSRAASPSGSRNHSRAPSRHHSSATSPYASPSLRGQHGQSPPLTPAATQGKPAVPRADSSGAIPKVSVDQSNLTPQISPGGGSSREQGRKSLPTSRAASRHGSRASSPAGRSSTAKFSLGSSAQSIGSESRDTSPSRDGKSDETRNKRRSQIGAFDSIEAKFKHFGTSKRSSGFGIGGSSSRSGSSVDVKEAEKHGGSGHHHGLFGGRHKHGAEEEGAKHGGSMHDLKRFFKFGGSHKPKSEHSSTTQKPNRSGMTTPPSSKVAQPTNIPFSDDHTLEAKYGKFGKVLGSGAGGSVRLMKRSSDGVTFAVKQFRARHSYESEKEYNKKVTAEFCVGSTLHHGNIIETMDIIHEHNTWYEVMEYAPFDLFAIVMTGRMSKPEVTCCFLQIVAGVSYLHDMGLAHRDLKLDNVVVNEFGIMKLIDFGSAVVFRYPFEKDIVKATGIVGSDPYLAPEVYDEVKYDPRAVDIWSLAIIYCCMSLRRFPWKIPRLTDTSYKYFVAEPTPGTPSVESLRKRSVAIANERGTTSSARVDGAADASTEATQTTSNGSASGHRASQSEMAKITDSRPETPDSQEQKQPQTIKGPWRLLRLLPRDSRYIIGRMLDVDPKSRATLSEVQQDSWISTQPVCRQEPGGQVIRAEGHEHVLEPGAGASAPPPAKK